MKNSEIFKYSLGFSLLAVIYVTLVATIMQNAENIFGADDESVIAPIAFLLLLTVSAATMGLLVFGKPVMLYLDGKKQEAVTMVAYTIGCMAAFTGILLVVMALI